MPSSPNGPIRRAQLIAPFGVGAMVVVPGGTSLVIGGLDYWYISHDQKSSVDPTEFEFEEWRLQALLGVSHFRLPPDFREYFMGQLVPNVGITIPSFRFPTWHFCSDKNCRLLTSFPMYTRGSRGRVKCPECEKKKKTRYMYQVPFVAMCEKGHLQDFPWREWVHHEINPVCQGELKLKSTGSATLAGQKVVCSCGKERTLSGITSSGSDGSTTLSKTLVEGDNFLCRGERPWLGPDNFERCDSHLRGSLRSASNLYFAQIVSSIYLPLTQDLELQNIENLLQSPPLSGIINLCLDLELSDPSKIAKRLRAQHPALLSGFTDSQVTQVLDQLINPQSAGDEVVESNQEDSRTAFRRAEYKVLCTERNDHLLRISKGNLEKYEPSIQKYFSRIMLVSKLRETRVLGGFSRILPETLLNQEQRQGMLWKVFPPTSYRWLPAYVVYGEGIFLEFNQEMLASWEKQPDVLARLQPLGIRFKEIQESRRQQERTLEARNILLHTFSHIVMNRLTFECGYSSAALRERLYVSDNPDAPMAGVLIYTADGDSEGTMGGLVRMGKPGYLEPVIRRALEGARWCSADPICMEMGQISGQGPDSCNLAACHNCALVPETACEEFNRFLDRGVLIGSLDNPDLGFFNSW